MKNRLGRVETLARRNNSDHKLLPSLDVIMKHCHNVLLLSYIFLGFLGMHVGHFSNYMFLYTHFLNIYELLLSNYFQTIIS